LSNGGVVRLTSNVRGRLAGNTSQTACGAWLLRSCNSGINAENPIETTGDKPQDAGRQARDDPLLNAVEIGPARFPVLWVPGDPDPLVRPEFDEFERASADRMRAHVAR